MSGPTAPWAGERPGRRRLVPGWALFVAFVAVPLLEIYVLIQVGQVIGAWWTVLLLIVASVIGSWLIKREGTRAWRSLQEALHAGRMPARELADGALILIGGTLMLTPGFVSDLVGTVLILPFTRPLARRGLTRILASRLRVVPGAGGLGPFGAGFGPGGGPHRGGSDGGSDGATVVPGEVVDPDRDPEGDRPAGPTSDPEDRPPSIS